MFMYSIRRTRQLAISSQKWVSKSALVLARDSAEVFVKELLITAAGYTHNRKIRPEHLEKAVSSRKVWIHLNEYIVNSIHSAKVKPTPLFNSDYIPQKKPFPVSRVRSVFS